MPGPILSGTVLALIFCIGLPIALLVQGSKKTETPTN
jgi:hypothetical protein